MHSGKALAGFQAQAVVHNYERLVKGGEVEGAKRVYEANPDLAELFNQINEQYGHLEG